VARQQRRLVPGDVVTASVPALGLSGAALVVASTIDERGSVPTIALAAGSAPSTSIVASTAAYEPETYTGVNVATVNGDRVVTITDTSGRPIAGASCRLNGSITRTSDSAGRVAFPVAQMPAGSHVIDITAQGFQPFRLAVRV
jgi:DNA-binding MurR/RpiR family transcriptional regulator